MARGWVRWLGIATLAACGYPELPRVAEPCGEWPEPGLYEVTVDTPEKKRKALVEIGATTGPRDMVVAVHGGSQNALEFRDGTRFGDLVDTEPLVVVYPQGRKTLFWRMWNAGECCGTLDEEHRDADDVGFLEQLVAELSPQVCADRVLAAGFSQGGMMVNRWGCQGKNLDAVVAAAGPMMINGCSGEPRPFRAYHGTADDTVPLAGGTGRSGQVFPPASEGWERWKVRNRCEADPVATFVFGPQTCVRFGCDAPTEVCTIDGWAHAWPGGRNGATRLESDATRDSLQFLRTAVPRDRDSGTAPTASDEAASEETGDTASR